MDKKILMNHYDNIDELTLYRWDKYTSTKDNNWFLVDYDGRQKKISDEWLNKVEESIQDQYFKAIDDRSFSLKIQKWAKIGGLKTKYTLGDSLLHFMWLGFGSDKIEQGQRFLIVKELRKIGFKIPEICNLEEERDLIIQYRKALEGIKTQIAIIASELKEDAQKETKGLYAQISIAKMALKGYEMNPRTMVLSEWIEICKLVQEISKKN